MEEALCVVYDYFNDNHGIYMSADNDLGARAARIIMRRRWADGGPAYIKIKQDFAHLARAASEPARTVWQEIYIKFVDIIRKELRNER